MTQSRMDDFREPEPCRERRFETENGHIVHPVVREGTIISRGFQMDIASRAISGSTLVVLPTGIGKTIIAILVTAELLQNGGGKVVMVAPTRPLVEQHLTSFKHFLKIDEMVMFSGSMKPDRRVEEWKKARIVFSTPQTINNDLKKERYDLSDVSLLIVDEAHRSVGDYAYTGILSRYDSLVLALTASPGGDRDKIMEVVENLKVEHVEARSDHDQDVMEHIKGIEVEWKKVQLTGNMTEIKGYIEDFLMERVRKLRKLGFLRNKKANIVSKKDLLQARGEITARYNKKKGLMFGSLHNQSQAVITYHCIELLETQGVVQCRSYLDRMRAKEKKTKAERGFLKDERIINAISMLDAHDGPTHPKMDILVDLVRSAVRRGETSIVFTQIRDTIPLIMERLDDVRVERFVGQAKGKDGKGLKQKEQKDILDRFRRREFDVLIATSVAEEGIDIPDVDLVVFYEPIPSEIRTIQRRGRTGRSSKGKVIVLITSKTRDEAYLWAERSREKKMGNIIHWLHLKDDQQDSKRSGLDITDH
ncbi:MAG: helicase-related protein [Candidatus Thermoplasmatota archaeon]|nr:helicase-related protein [Candidatus Thermoplasmatota archaeon]